MLNVTEHLPEIVCEYIVLTGLNCMVGNLCVCDLNVACLKNTVAIREFSLITFWYADKSHFGTFLVRFTVSSTKLSNSAV